MSAIVPVASSPRIASQARGALRLTRLSEQARGALRRARRHFAPPERLTLMEWAADRRYLHSGPLKGNKFNWDETPALKGIAAAYHEPGVSEIWVQKSAQVGFTQGIYMNLIGFHAELDPCPILVLFAKDGAGKRFMREKLEPMILATPKLKALIPMERRSARNTVDFKWFPGGFVQLAGTGSAPNVKSTDAKLVVVEEPDDTAKNLAGQGDAIAMGRERKKSYGDGVLLVGGTPTVKGLSKVAEGMRRTDQRRMFVACPHCGHEQTLRWEQVQWQQDSPVHHPIYGTHRPDTARYLCEAEGCGALWSETERRTAIVAASRRPDHGWRATAAATGVIGFYINELYSLFTESRLAVLAQKFIEASAALKRGDDSLMRSFVNNTLGEPWEIRGTSPETEDLIQRGEGYAEWTCPSEALVATCWVDVQRGGEQSGPARLHYVVVGWGRGMESWRIARGVVLGNPLEKATWAALDAELAAHPIRNLGGGTLPISMMGVDSGDGMTQEAVYDYVRAKQREGRRCIATKGSNQPHKPIFSLPKKEDANAQDRAARWGLKLYLIGVDAAKETIAGRLKLFERDAQGRAYTGRGEARMHWPAALGQDYLEQIVSEVKIPGRNGRLVWQTKAGARNEDLDCEVGNLHAAYKLRLHQMPESWWRQLEERVRQADLLSADIPGGLPASPFAGAIPPATPTATGGARRFTGYRG